MEYEKLISGFLRRHHLKSVKPTVALIDMDGTLYDSMVNHTAAWKRMTDEIGMDIRREEFYLFEGMTGAATINMLFNREFNRDATEEEKAGLYRRKTEYFRELPPVKVMPGASELLDMMAETGMRRVLVTGSGQTSLIDRLNRDFPGIFDPGLMVTSRNTTHGKPHPEPYIKGMQLAGARPSNCIAVENAPLGVRSADASGAFTVGLTTGPVPREELLKAGAAVVYDSMQQFADDFPQLILSLFNTELP